MNTNPYPQVEGLAGILCCLTREFDTLVFWKHIERGLDGSGDIDSIAPPEIAHDICGRFAELAAKTWPDVLLVFRCKHTANVHPIFVVRRETFPTLLQFDVSYRPSRMGVPWLEPNRLAEFSILNKNGIRILRPGPLAVVLAFLYGMQRKGNHKIKRHDLQDIAHGLQNDSVTAERFVEKTLPNRIQLEFRRLIREAPQLPNVFGNVDADWSVSAWKACLTAAVQHHTASFCLELPSLLAQRLSGYCEVRQIVHHHNRVVPSGDLETFMQHMILSESVLFQSNQQT